MHETGIHGGPATRVVGAAAALAFVFGTAVLVADAVGGDSGTEHMERSTQQLSEER